MTSEWVFSFWVLCLTFNFIIASIPFEVSILYLEQKCLWTRRVHRHQDFDPCDLDLKPPSIRWVSLSSGNSQSGYLARYKKRFYPSICRASRKPYFIRVCVVVTFIKEFEKKLQDVFYFDPKEADGVDPDLLKKKQGELLERFKHDRHRIAYEFKRLTMDSNKRGQQWKSHWVVAEMVYTE